MYRRWALYGVMMPIGGASLVSGDGSWDAYTDANSTAANPE
jgi:hypothetical protein